MTDKVRDKIKADFDTVTSQKTTDISLDGEIFCLSEAVEYARFWENLDYKVNINIKDSFINMTITDI